MTDVKNRFAVRRIDHRDAMPFIMGIHYARRRPCIQYAFGLFDGDYPYPVGVVTYGQPASAPLCKGIAGEENRAHVLELNRLVLYPEYNGGVRIWQATLLHTASGCSPMAPMSCHMLTGRGGTMWGMCTRQPTGCIPG